MVCIYVKFNADRTNVHSRCTTKEFAKDHQEIG